MARTNIATLGIQLTATNAKFKSVMRDSQRQLAGFKSSVGRIAGGLGKIAGVFGGVSVAGATAGFVALTKSQFDAVDTLAKTADALGVTTRGLAALNLAASLGGVSTEGMSKGLRKMIRTVSEADAGIGSSAKSIKELNLNASELSQLSPERQFATIGEALFRLQNQGDKVRLAGNIFGERQGAAFLNLLKDGSAGLNVIAGKVDNYGLAISRVDAAKIEQANDSWEETKQLFAGIARNVAVYLAPYITKANQLFQDFATKAGPVGEQVKAAIQTIIDSIEKTLNRLDAFNPVLSALGEDITNTWKLFADAINSYVLPSLASVTNPLEYIKSLLDGITIIWKNLVGGFQRIERFATGGLAKVFGFLSGSGDSAASQRGRAVAEFFQRWSEGADDAVKKTNAAIKAFQSTRNLKPETGTGTKAADFMEGVQSDATAVITKLFSVDEEEDPLTSTFEALKDTAADATKEVDKTTEAVKNLLDVGQAGQTKAGSVDFKNIMPKFEVPESNKEKEDRLKAQVEKDMANGVKHYPTPDYGPGLARTPVGFLNFDSPLSGIGGRGMGTQQVRDDAVVTALSRIETALSGSMALA